MRKYPKKKKKTKNQKKIKEFLPIVEKVHSKLFELQLLTYLELVLYILNINNNKS